VVYNRLSLKNEGLYQAGKEQKKKNQGEKPAETKTERDEKILKKIRDWGGGRGGCVI